jgi:protein TonB
MNSHADILDQEESLRLPLIGAVTLHVGIVSFLVVFGWWTNRGRIQFGDPNAMGGSVGITAVSSIPLPHRTGMTNPVANDTESQVPSPPKPEEKRKVPKERPDAIPLHSKNVPKRVSDQVARNQKFRPLESDRPNQVYSSTGAAVQSPLYGGAAGMGGVGIGNSVFGDRFGQYANLLHERLARQWAAATATIPPGMTTSHRVLLAFDIQRDGTIQGVRILESSGNAQVDTAAQRAILSANPVLRLPEAFEKPTAHVEYYFQLQR